MKNKNTRREFIKTTSVLAAGTVALSAFGKNPVNLILEPSKDFILEPLPYAYADLEPFIDAQTMEIHYSKHHQGYVTNLNKALAENKMETITLVEIFSNITKYPAVIRNNAGGHYNHTMFWKMMKAPISVDLNSISGDEKDQDKAAEKFKEIIIKTFGTFEAFQQKFSDASKSVFGSGWCWLVVNDKKELEIGTTPNQDNPLMSDSKFKGTPVLGLDVWEHAYYLKHQNKRIDYITAWWNVVNWEHVYALHAAAIK